MKKIVLSTITALSIASVSVSAASITLYEDANGQVFTKPGVGRTEMFISTDMITNKVEKEQTYTTPHSVKLSKEDKDEIKQDLLAEVKKVVKDTPLFAKSDKLKFSALAYLGYRYSDYDTYSSKNGGATRPLTISNDEHKANQSEFEIRRAYFQVKAYLLEDPKSYYRVTFDVSKDVTGDEKVRAKYVYLYLDDVLPSTGVEVGLAHRPWHDYEEHNAWYYRSVAKILTETKRAGDLSNSADYGVMAKTRTKYIDSDIGIFNGEGYHSEQNDQEGSNGMSLEWRLTSHLMGIDGKDKQTKKTYADASFFGQLNHNHLKVNGEYEDLNFYGFHTVYNQPDFLIAAQYIISDVDKVNGVASSKAGDGYSLNTEYRMGAEKQYKLFARYDFWTPEASSGHSEYDKKSYILGAAWHQNKNVEWLFNATIKDYDDGANLHSDKDSNNNYIPDDGDNTDTYSGTDYMLTARIKF